MVLIDLAIEGFSATQRTFIKFRAPPSRRTCIEIVISWCTRPTKPGTTRTRSKAADQRTETRQLVNQSRGHGASLHATSQGGGCCSQLLIYFTRLPWRLHSSICLFQNFR